MKLRIHVEANVNNYEEVGNVLHRVWADAIEQVGKCKDSGGVMDAGSVTGDYGKFKDRLRHDEAPDPLPNSFLGPLLKAST